MKDIPGLKESFSRDRLDGCIISKPANRQYLSGFTGTSGILLLTEKDNILLTDFRYREQAVCQAQDFTVVQHGPQLISTLREWLDKLGLHRIGVEKDHLTLAAYDELVRNIPGVEFIPIQNPCEMPRMVKSTAELNLLKKAIEISDQSFCHIAGFIHPGLTEKEVGVELEFSMRRLGSEKNAFTTIVASGERSALPHGVASDKVIQKGDLVTLDFGAVYQGYHSDMTRTLVIGPAQERHREIYEVVLTAQEAVLQALRPGMRGFEADGIARDLIKEAGFGEYFGHGLGHGVGLEIHEGPRLSPQSEIILEPGMVVSVEPGVYIAGWGGIRIEDLALITSSGCESLTKSPKRFTEMIL